MVTTLGFLALDRHRLLRGGKRRLLVQSVDSSGHDGLQCGQQVLVLGLYGPGGGHLDDSDDLTRMPDGHQQDGRRRAIAKS
ncbi:hypothetical protein D3C81_2072580 [compost metagenome]